MGLKRSQLQRFMERSQEVLEELYPSVVTVFDTDYPAAASSLRQGSEYDDGGQMPQLETLIRVAKFRLAEPWSIGTPLQMRDRDLGQIVRLRIIEQRADDGAWVFRCVAEDES